MCWSVKERERERERERIRAVDREKERHRRKGKGRDRETEENIRCSRSGDGQIYQNHHSGLSVENKSNRAGPLFLSRGQSGGQRGGRTRTEMLPPSVHLSGLMNTMLHFAGERKRENEYMSCKDARYVCSARHTKILCFESNRI